MVQRLPPLTAPSSRRGGVRRYALLPAAMAIWGCGGDAGAAPDPFADTWLMTGPDTRIGSIDDPDYVFGPIISLDLGPDGLLYTMHWDEGTIRRWTQDGAPAGSVGRKGEGPGEFEQPTDMGFFGDSLWVWDMDAYRVSYFDLEGEFLGSVSPKVDLGGRDENPARPDRPLRDGTFIGNSPAWSDGIARGTLTESPYVHMDADGNRLARIWAMPYEPRDVFAILADDGVGGSFSFQPFGDGYSFVVGEDGMLVLERRAWTGEGEAVVSVTKIGLDGDTVFTVAVPYDPVPLAAARFDSAVAARAERWKDNSGPFSATEADVRDAMYRPSYLPAVRGIWQAGDGTIWLRRYDPVETEDGESMTESWILDAKGAPLARALTPAGLSIRVISGDTVWGIERDELDVQYMVRYRLVKDG